MFRGRATETFAMRKISVREFKLELDRRFFHSVFVDTKGASVVSHSYPTTYFKRSRRRHWFPSNPLNYADTQRYNQQMLSQTLAPLKRIEIPLCRRGGRLFTTRAKGSSKTGSHKRKKKTLLPSSNKKMTTKDRLRLSSRPSTSAMNSRQNKNSTEVDRMIKSPEELMERLSSGLDIARTVAQEGYASLRNPAAAASSGRNAGNKHDNHLLSARPGPSGSNDGTRPIPQKGLVMDANWWFWNLCLAASPAILVALYCQFIVKPEMKIRNEQREKDALSEENERAKKNSVGDEIGVDERCDNNENKMSPMRKRQEEQKHQQQQSRDGATTRKSASSPELNGGINEMLSSYTRKLISWISEPPSPPTEVSEDCQSHESGTDGVDKRKNKMKPHENQKHRKEEIKRLEIQRQELKELQSQLQMLQDKIDRQQQQRADLNPDSDGDDSDLVSENDAKSESPSASIGDRMKSATEGGIKLGRERWVTLLDWWQRRGRRRQSSDESNGGGDENGVVATGNGRRLSTASER